MINVTSSKIPDVLIIEPKVFQDHRGYMMESYQRREFAAHGMPERFAQENQSGSMRGTLRGIHYQLKHAQGKLVRVIAGEVFDVAVDLRRSSPTFGQWVGVVLSAENKLQMWVPAGFGHGFLTLSERAEFLYKTTDFYAPKWERGILWNDPQIGIEWPVTPDLKLLLSEKDQHGKLLKDAELYD